MNLTRDFIQKTLNLNLFKLNVQINKINKISMCSGLKHNYSLGKLTKHYEITLQLNQTSEQALQTKAVSPVNGCLKLMTSDDNCFFTCATSACFTLSRKRCPLYSPAQGLFLLDT